MPKAPKLSFFCSLAQWWQQSSRWGFLELTTTNAGLLDSNKDFKPPNPQPTPLQKEGCTRNLSGFWLDFQQLLLQGLLLFQAYQNLLTSRNPGVSHSSLTYSRKHGTSGTSVRCLVCQLDPSQDHLGRYLS